MYKGANAVTTGLEWRNRLVVVPMILAGALSGCSKEAAPPPRRPAPPVSVVTVAPGTIPYVSTFVAQTESSQQVDIVARVSGFLDRIAYQEGELVKEGQLLFQLDQKPFQAQLEGAIGAAKALYYPSLSLTAALGLGSTDLGDLVKSSSSTGSLAAGLVGPIFTFGRIEGQVNTTEAAQREALAFYQQVVLNAFRESNDALTGLEKRREEQAALAKRAAALRQYARLSRARFEGGFASYVDVLYAENELFSAELTAVVALAQRFAELVNVYKAFGGGWIDVADPLMQRPPAAPAPMRTGNVAGIAPGDDPIAVHVEGDATVVTVTLPQSGPRKVVLRFVGFPELESVKAQSPRADFNCELIRLEGDAPRHACRVDGVEVDALRPQGDGFEVVLPPGLLSAPGERAEVRWVDRWR